MIENIGGLAELKNIDGPLIISSPSCPLAESVRDHPQACELAEALFSELMGVKVIERCDKNGTPRCRFEIASWAMIAPMRSFLFIIFTIMLASCNQAAVKPLVHYLALGDSYTIGESVEESQRWPVQLVQMLRQEKIDLGEPQIIAQTGWTAHELSAGIDAENPRGPFPLVTLLIGVNNQFRGRSVDEFRTQFSDL